MLHAVEPRRLGNYELAELLGSGGMGDVFRARHYQFGRVRAIKVIKQHFVDAGHEDVVRRFYQEIKATGALEHPNIVVAVESSAPDRPRALPGDGVHRRDIARRSGDRSTARSPFPTRAKSFGKRRGGWSTSTGTGWSIATSSRRT